MPEAKELLAPIEADAVYPLPVFEARTGLGKHIRSKCRRDGLPVRKLGNRCYVVGREFLEFVEQHGEAQ